MRLRVRGINSLGQFVGVAQQFSSSGEEAMFFDGVSYVHFSLPGLESISLYDINDKGQILGTDWTGTELTAFLATPVVDTTPNEVPEPSTTLSGILVCGLLLAGARQKVRRGNAG